MQTMYPLQKCKAGADISSLSNMELLAIILGTGTKKVNVLELASMVLSEHGGITGLLNAGYREIAQGYGMGLSKALKIHSSFEIGKRAFTIKKNIAGTISNPKKVWELLLPEVASRTKEIFFTLILSNKNILLKKTITSIGTISETIVHPREVYREAIRECGSSIIIAHNHPSGEITPSQEDIITTKRIGEAGQIIGIPLLDHVILSNNHFLSMKEEGYDF